MLRYSGTCCLQISVASGHLVWNLHPEGGLTGLGISPCNTILSLRAVGSGIGIADINALVYGCNGLLNNSSLLAISTIEPRYITPTVSHKCSTTPRSCEINR